MVAFKDNARLITKLKGVETLRRRPKTKNYNAAKASLFHRKCSIKTTQKGLLKMTGKCCGKQPADFIRKLMLL